MSTHKYFDWFVGAVMAICVLLTVGFLLKGGQQADSETLIPAEIRKPFVRENSKHFC